MIKITSSPTHAILYTRVSTEEQAIHGGSLKTQQDVLRQFCQLRNIVIDKLFIEDHSAKTFNRPEWRKLMAGIEASKEKPDYVLFTRWDRFSRNTGDAYYALKKLKTLGVEAQAIEQPLDLSIPENKMMFAFYLAIPEVENDRRGLNTKMGIQRAKERGKWLGRPPIGYKNHCFADGLKTIVHKEPDASIIKFAFHQLANLRCNITDAYLIAAKEGMKCSRSNFWKMLQNPIYIGSIKITDTQNASSYIIPGMHRAIVSTPTFDRVQQLFFKKRSEKNVPNRNSRNPKFVLKGFIACPKCGRTLMASASTGQYARYYYYHCNSKCGYRIRSEILYSKFISKLTKVKPLNNYHDIYKTLIEFNYAKQAQKINKKRKREIESIELFTERIRKAKDLLLDGHIEFDEYNNIKSDLEAKIRLIGYSIEANSKKQMDLIDKINNAMGLFARLDRFMDMLDEQNKHAFLSIILKPNQNWGSGNIDHIFKKPFQIVYGLEKGSGNNQESYHQEIENFLKKMADIELLITY